MLGLQSILNIALTIKAVSARLDEGLLGGTFNEPSPKSHLYTKDLSSCPGYVATKHWKTDSGFYADLELAGGGCNIYGVDLPHLKLEVEYQTEDRLHVKILDTNNTVYQLPDEVFPRPGHGQWCSSKHSKLKFNFKADPFSFSVSRSDSGEILFDTTSNKLVFESQYVHLKTRLPQDPHLYGLGEHSDPFMLRTKDYSRTIWTHDSYSIPQGQNLYGGHPIYFDHREGSGTHGVFLLNSNGMDIYVDDKDGQSLEYNIIGGVLDFYFMAGPSPKEVAMQYAEITQMPLMTPYWGLGFHQCKYGYRDIYQVAEVVANYSKADIPLETMWSDIDYMNLRRVFTLDPERFSLDLVKDFVDTLHARHQYYIVMVDPGVWSDGPNPALNAGIEYDTFMKTSNGSLYRGVVWPGPTVYPDWFHPNCTRYWNDQFLAFFDGVNGPDIDGLWIDMNEPSNGCNSPYPCLDPDAYAKEKGRPPVPPPLRCGPDGPLPGFPDRLQGTCGSDDVKKRSVNAFQESQKLLGYDRGRKSGNSNPKILGSSGKLEKEINNGWQSGKKSGSGCGPGQCLGLPGREYIRPPYMIRNSAGPTLAEGTADTDIIHHGGLVEYDVHNLYGTMMSTRSKDAMLARRPNKRPLIITRSTWAGAGRDVSHWLGDNISGWSWYRVSIGQALQFASLYQMPVVGSDVCGHGGDTTVPLCARWATLGSFSTFMRNHAQQESAYQEFYRWPLVASAARNGIRMRYLLLDYIYTAIYHQNQTGLPCMNPLFFNYPEDPNTYPIELQFFYGDGILVSPVTEDDSTHVDYYLPDDIFYEFDTGKAIRGKGAYVSAEVLLDEILVHYKGGHIFPQRVESANTTTALRTKGFDIVIAPGLDGKATGSLYLDDGESIVQDAVSEIAFSYDGKKLSMTGSFEYDAGVGIERITVLGVGSASYGQPVGDEYDAENQKIVMKVEIPLDGPMEMTVN